MNFLSHYYFEKNNKDAYMVIGVVLPDFVKNAHKDWNLHPQKEEVLFINNPNHSSILKGWIKHLEVDRLFHNSSFFIEQTAILKQIILPATQDGPVKPFFLAHIALELVLDHLLTTDGRINIPNFYSQLMESNTPILRSFLEKAALPDAAIFDKFINGFISSRYLLSYQKIENITYALNRICMRLWNNPFSEEQMVLLTSNLHLYIESIKDKYMIIFNQIENKLQDD
jgi:acyl carrier protein phosphodiesterase